MSVDILENRMVIDSEWEPLERRNSEQEEEKTDDCYLKYKGMTFDTEEEAFAYAVSECVYGDTRDEFKDALLEWFFSDG